jgi:hypothetical protein
MIDDSDKRNNISEASDDRVNLLDDGTCAQRKLVGASGLVGARGNRLRSEEQLGEAGQQGRER